MFLAGRINLSNAVSRLHHRISLTTEAYLELMVVGLSAQMVRYKSYFEHLMDTFTSPPFLHGRIWTKRLGHILGWQMAPKSLVTTTEQRGYYMEGVICYSRGSLHMGLSLALAKNSLPLS